MYLSYYGPFTIDEQKGTVVHHVVGVSYPHCVGSERMRYFTRSDDGRTLEFVREERTRVTSTLTWTHVE